MRTVGAFEAKTHLGQLLDEVARGETITITRHGEPVAVLVPPNRLERPDPAEAIKKWREYQEANKVVLGPGLTVRELIDEGRRF